jgi:hypothetical protein
MCKSLVVTYRYRVKIKMDQTALSRVSGSGKSKVYECRRHFPVTRFFSIPISIQKTTQRNHSTSLLSFEISHRMYVPLLCSSKADRICRAATKPLYETKSRIHTYTVISFFTIMIFTDRQIVVCSEHAFSSVLI